MRWSYRVIGTVHQRYIRSMGLKEIPPKSDADFDQVECGHELVLDAGTFTQVNH